ncbi:MAG: site-specific integrase [Ignavibacteriales bacterium]|nr:site-specific integrase [Ignavibacteriales bacterium]
MKHKTIAMVIDEYLSEIQFVKRYSEKTIISYRIDLMQFSKYILENFEIDSLERLSPVFLKKYVMHLN